MTASRCSARTRPSPSQPTTRSCSSATASPRDSPQRRRAQPTSMPPRRSSPRPAPWTPPPPPTPARNTVLSGGDISAAPIPARLGWQPTTGGLRLAWQLVIDDSSDDHLWNATVDAQTGELLATDDWTDRHTPAELATTLGRAETAAPAASQAVDDGSSYRVFALPKESPNDGGRSLVATPADDVASPFGWHDTDGAPGPEFTTTRGNNVHAYTDRDANNAPDPHSDPDGGPDLTFDFPLDLNGHPQTYTDAAVTN